MTPFFKPKKQKSVSLLAQLDEVTQNLQSELKRSSQEYLALLTGISRELNNFTRGSMTGIDVDELKDQIGHLLYFEVKSVERRVPFDIKGVPGLRSHFKNPTVIVLRRIRRYLMASHRKTLAKLEEEQARERRINFKSLDINQSVKNSLNGMIKLEHEAKAAETISRRLDILTKALHLPASNHADFRLIRRILNDEHHLRHREASQWLNDSSFGGNQTVLENLMVKGLDILDKKSREIFDEMERLSGIPFDRNTSNIEASFNWYSLGTPLRRGEDFVRIFENEEQLEKKIKKYTYFMVRTAWDADRFRDQMEQYRPGHRDMQENAEKLSMLYFDLEEKIRESTVPDSQVQTAIKTDEKTGQLSAEEAIVAREWVQQNKASLQQVKLELFTLLQEIKEVDPNVVLAEQLEGMLDSTVEETVSSAMPKISIMDLHRKLETLEERLIHPDPQLLKELCDLHRQMVERAERLNSMAFQQQLRNACSGFDQYEEKLLELDKAEGRLGEMKITCQGWMIEVYRDIDYDDSDREHLEYAFDVLIDKMLYEVKSLNYEPILANQFEDLFERALHMENQQALFHLDFLLHEIHVIPRQDQLLHALGDWESTLGKRAYEEKQELILENEVALQSLVDDVRAELRERIGKTQIKPRRLRFEVFSLADSYAGNLRSLLNGLLRMAPTLTSADEGERLIANLQAIESQIIEAQRVTKPKGEAYTKLAEMAKLKLFPPEIVEDLRTDLVENFTDLNQLLKDTNQGLERVRKLQNRFGGDHEVAHLTITINIHDLESLKDIYNFVDNITIMDMKRFGVVYKQRYSLMEDLYEKAKNKDPSVSPDLLKAIDSKVYKAFKHNHHVSVPLKTLIFKEAPEILDFECQLLIRTMNFVSNSHIRKKAVYVSVLKILEQVDSANIPKRRVLRRIWVKIRSALQGFEPRNFKKNYENNMRCLVVDAKGIIGSRFEDL